MNTSPESLMVRIVAVDDNGNNEQVLIETLDVFLVAAELDTIKNIKEWEFVSRL